MCQHPHQPSTNITITSSNGSKFRINTVGNANNLGFGSTTVTGVADVAEAQAGNTAVNSFVAAGSQQTSLLSFTGIRNGGDDQTITVTANDADGAAHSLAVVLRNDSTTRNAGTVDEAIDAINTALKQSNDTTLQKVVAVKDKASGAGAEGIKFASTLHSFKVAIGTNEGNSGVGSQGSVVTAATVGTGSTADITTQAGAERAVTALADAVSTLGNAQAVVGRGQNQFNYAVNLAQSQLTNLAAAESRIRDADLAAESANLTKSQILLQAGIVGLLGFGLGIGGAALFFEGTKDVTHLAGFLMPWQIVALTAGAVTLIVALASLLSLRRVLVLEPAVVFR